MKLTEFKKAYINLRLHLRTGQGEGNTVEVNKKLSTDELKKVYELLEAIGTKVKHE